MIAILRLLSSILIIIAVYLFIGKKPEYYGEALIRLKEKGGTRNIKKTVLLNSGKKKENPFFRYFEEVELILKESGKSKSFPLLIFYALVFGVLGVLLAIVFSQVYLSVVLFFIFFTSPFVVISLLMQNYRQDIADELEVTMSIVTSTYERTDNIVVSIEDNLEHMPLKIRKGFQEFIKDIRLNIHKKDALYRLKNRFVNPIFEEWVDNLILCQDDSSIKLILPAIVKKMGVIRTVNAEARVKLAVYKFSSIAMLVLSCSLPLFVYWLMSDYVGNFFSTQKGQFNTALLVLVNYLATLKIISIIKPMTS